jgi:TPR repeat protein
MKDLNLAFKNYKLSADGITHPFLLCLTILGGNKDAQYKIGSMYMRGTGVKKNVSVCLTLLLFLFLFLLFAVISQPLGRN